MRGFLRLLALVCALVAPSLLRAATVDPSIGRVEVTLDLPQDKPYVGEMIMLRMRSFIRADVVLDEIDQPPLLNFSWQQLGRDKPIQAMIDGFQVSGVERDLALFPTTSGRLIVEPFRRDVTIVTSDGERVTASFTSKPVYVDVQNYTAINPANSWWMPAKSVSLSESWSETPDEMKPGTLAKRTITIEAGGLTADRLPPPPEVSAPGTISFRGPVSRETIITDEGPVARGIYTWELRPVTAAPALLPAIHVTWFDTQTRRIRDSALPETWMALLGTLVHPSHQKPVRLGLLSPGPLAIGVAVFAWFAAMAAVLARRGLRREGRRERRKLRSLKAAARAHDRGGVLVLLAQMRQEHPRRWAAVMGDPAFAAQVEALERSAFSRQTGTEPKLSILVAEFTRLWRQAALPGKEAQDRLAPLDGPIERKLPGATGWQSWRSMLFPGRQSAGAHASRLRSGDHSA